MERRSKAFGPPPSGTAALQSMRARESYAASLKRSGRCRCHQFASATRGDANGVRRPSLLYTAAEYPFTVFSLMSR